MAPSIIPNKTSSLLNKSRDDKFVLVLTLPEILKQNQGKTRTNRTFDFESLQFAVQGTVVPKIEVPAIEPRYGGSTVPISSHARPTYGPLILTFKIDSRFTNYWVIFFWLNALRDQHEGVYGIIDVNNNFSKISNLGDYSTSFSVYGRDEYDKECIKFTYNSIFPTSLSEIQYDYQNGNEISCTASFAFRNLEVELVD